MIPCRFPVVPIKTSCKLDLSTSQTILHLWNIKRGHQWIQSCSQRQMKRVKYITMKGLTSKYFVLCCKFVFATAFKSLKPTAQKMKFPIKYFFSKCGQTSSFWRIWSHFLKKSLMGNFIFCAVTIQKGSSLNNTLNIFFYVRFKSNFDIKKNWHAFRKYAPEKKLPEKKPREKSPLWKMPPENLISSQRWGHINPWS